MKSAETISLLVNKCDFVVAVVLYLCVQHFLLFLHCMHFQCGACCSATLCCLWLMNSNVSCAAKQENSLLFTCLVQAAHILLYILGFSVLQPQGYSCIDIML